jgi:hypothetical protein
MNFLRKGFGVIVLSCGLAVPALLAVAQSASAAQAPSAGRSQPAACGWETIYSATASEGGTVDLEYDTCNRDVRAYGHGLPDNYGCHINLGCHGIVTQVWVYNENTGQEDSSGALADSSSYTTGAFSDAGTASHACIQDGGEVNGTISWDAKVCTSYF